MQDTPLSPLIDFLQKQIDEIKCQISMSRGCIYPPTSEKTFQAPLCPRHNPFTGAGMPR